MTRRPATLLALFLPLAPQAQASLHRGAGHIDLLFTSFVFSCWAGYWFWKQVRARRQQREDSDNESGDHRDG